MSGDPHNIGVEIAHLLILAQLARMKNTPTESSTVYQAGQDKAGAEANQLLQAGELVNDSSKRRVVKTTEVQQ